MLPRSAEGAARPRSRSRLQRAARLGLAAIGALLGIAAVLVAIVVHGAADRVHAAAVAEADRLGERLGRAVTVGPARVRFGAELSIEIDAIRIAGAEGEAGVAAEALLEIPSLRVGVAAWPLLRSRGKEIQVTAIDVGEPLIRVVRLEGGRLSYADVIEHLASAPPRPEPARQVSVGRVAVHAGTIRLYDLSAPDRGAAPLMIRVIDVVIPALRPDAPLDLAIDAAVLAPGPNLHLALTLAPSAADPGVPAPPLGRLTRAVLRLAPVEIAPLVPFLPAPRGFRVKGATLSAEGSLSVDAAGPITLDGEAAAAALTLSHSADGGEETAFGQPTDVRVRADLTLDPAGEALSVRSLVLGAGEMAIEAHADLRGPAGAPEVRALSARARGVTFERLVALAPPSLLPRGVELHGPIELLAEGHGDPRAAEVDVTLDLGGAALSLPELHKPAGTPLSAELHGRAGEGGLEVASLGLVLGPLALRLHGKVASGSDLDLSFDSGSVPLDAMLRLLPTVARAAPAGVTLAGDVQASGRVRRKDGATRAEARVALRRAGVKTPALTLEGAADLDAAVRTTPGGLAINADLDAAAAHVVVPGRVDKAAGAPLAVHVSAERSGDVTTVREARLAITGATAQGSGRYDGAAHALAIEAPGCDLDLGALARTVPALGVIPAALSGARLHAAVSLDGDPRDLAAAHLRLAELDLRAPLGHLHGLLDLRGLSPPRRVAFDLDGDALDLDALGEGRLPGGGAPLLDRLEIDGKLRLGRLHVRALDARDVTVELDLAGGAATLRALRFSALGGAVVAGGSRVDFAHGEPAFAVRAHVDHLDLSALPGSAWSRGRVDADVTLDGRGATWPAIAPTLAGTVGLDLTDAHVHTMHTVRATILNPLLGKLAAKAKEKKPVREVDMSIPRAAIRVRVAGNQVTTTTPARAETEDGTLTLDGAVGFDGHLALGGVIVIPPAALDKASSGKLVPFKDVTVKLRVLGQSSDPQIELLELGKTFEALAGSGVHGLVRKVEGLFEK
jgi:uncharacterized protein involved in outer membrane biogenesis